jgi:cytochrome c oxidase subunit III
VSINSHFRVADGIYGLCFYLLTRFCVFVGTAAIIVGLILTAYKHFTATQHLRLGSAVWYWHFVDVVWVLVFMVIYGHN